MHAAPPQDLGSQHRTRLLLRALKGARGRCGSDLLAGCGFPGARGREWLETLLESGILVHTDRFGRRGPRDRELALNTGIGVLTADIGHEGIVLDLRDLSGERKASSSFASWTPHPRRTAGSVSEQVRELYSRGGQTAHDVRAVVVGVSPALRSGEAPEQEWVDAGSTVRALGPLERVTVESRTSLLAVGRSTLGATGSTVLHVEIGFDVEAGIVTDGSIIRGGDGAAGGLGHFVVPDRRDAHCWCGNRGCLTAVAGGRALAEQLGLAPGIDSLERLLAAERAGNVRACAALRTAGWQLGHALRSCAGILDPDEIVVAGVLGAGSTGLRWGISEIFESQPPTPRCPVVYSTSSEDVFARGAAERAIHLAVQRCFEQPVAVAG